MLTQKDVDEFYDYLKSGRWDEDFGYRTQDGQGEMLDLIESLFRVCELADQVISERFYRHMQGMFPGDREG